jgi:hypothetical protein
MELVTAPRELQDFTLLVLDDVRHPEQVADDDVHPIPGEDFTHYYYPGQSAVELTQAHLGVPAALIPGLPFTYTGVSVTSEPEGTGLPGWARAAALLAVLAGGIVIGLMFGRRRPA